MPSIKHRLRACLGCHVARWLQLHGVAEYLYTRLLGCAPRLRCRCGPCSHLTPTTGAHRGIETIARAWAAHRQSSRAGTLMTTRYDGPSCSSFYATGARSSCCCCGSAAPLQFLHFLPVRCGAAALCSCGQWYVVLTNQARCLECHKRPAAAARILLLRHSGFCFRIPALSLCAALLTTIHSAVCITWGRDCFHPKWKKSCRASALNLRLPSGRPD